MAQTDRAVFLQSRPEITENGNKVITMCGNNFIRPLSEELVHCFVGGRNIQIFSS